MSLNTVLVIDKDKQTRQEIRPQLEKSYIVIDAATGQRAVQLIKDYFIDIILMDEKTSRFDGNKTLENIKNITNAPVILISSSHEPVPRIISHRSYADDYIKRPFDTEFLHAKLRNILKPHVDLMTKVDQDKTINYRFKNKTLNCQKYEIRDDDGTLIQLTENEVKLLHVFFERPNCVVAREELCRLLGETGSQTSPRAIDVKITRLRKKLGCSESNGIIRTVWGRGYMLDSDVQAIP